LSRRGSSEELADSLSELAGVVISEENIESTTRRIAERAVHLIGGADLAGISFVRDRDILTVGVTDDRVTELDAIQYETGEGPCLSSIREQETFEIADMESDQTWPNFSPRAAQLGVSSLLSFVLKVSDDSLGALNLYSRSSNAFAPTDRALGGVFAAHAGIALANARTHAGDLRRVEELEEGLDTRDLIGAAIGILMERERSTSSEAFKNLRRESQSQNKKLREVARDVVGKTERRAVGPPGSDESRSAVHDGSGRALP
jgi:GAF domain-containing protein